MRRAIEYLECSQQLADRCAHGGSLCTARHSPAIPYRRMFFFGQELPTPPSMFGGQDKPKNPASTNFVDVAPRSGVGLGEREVPLRRKAEAPRSRRGPAAAWLSCCAFVGHDRTSTSNNLLACANHTSSYLFTYLFTHNGWARAHAHAHSYLFT